VLPGMSVGITRVTEAVVTLTHTLPRTVKTIPDPGIVKGQSTVQAEGSDGQKTVTYRIDYKDGVETGREALQVVKHVEPVTRVILKGTKIPDDGWAKLRMCEAGGDYTRNSGNGYYGAYQFNLSTWQSNGGTGYPHQASPAVQDEIALRLYSRRGASPWPICGRYLSM
jgi:resuscitation-promoting factor RpfB